MSFILACILIGAASLALGLYWKSKFHKVKRECEKYEFEHRGSGGVVSFPSFEAAEQFRRKKKYAVDRISVGNFFVGVAFFMGVLVYFNLSMR